MIVVVYRDVERLGLILVHRCAMGFYCDVQESLLIRLVCLVLAWLSLRWRTFPLSISNLRHVRVVIEDEILLLSCIRDVVDCGERHARHLPRPHSVRSRVVVHPRPIGVGANHVAIALLLLGLLVLLRLCELVLNL